MSDTSNLPPSLGPGNGTGRPVSILEVLCGDRAGAVRADLARRRRAAELRLRDDIALAIEQSQRRAEGRRRRRRPVRVGTLAQQLNKAMRGRRQPCSLRDLVHELLADILQDELPEAVELLVLRALRARGRR